MHSNGKFHNEIFLLSLFSQPSGILREHIQKCDKPGVQIPQRNHCGEYKSVFSSTLMMTDFPPWKSA